MKLSEEVKKQIYEEFTTFKEKMYAGKTLAERQNLDQFFTPPPASITMIEMFKCESLNEKTILDPGCGSGNLLAACIIAGAQPKNIFGNDYDKDMVKLCKERLNALCDKLGLEHVPDENIHRGDALKANALTNWNPRLTKALQERDQKYADIKHENDNTYQPDIFS